MITRFKCLIFILIASSSGWTRADTGPRIQSTPLADSEGVISENLLQELSPERTGVFFNNTLEPSKGLTNQILFNGSGVAAGDVDLDGRPDLYFCGLDSANELYLNLGNWTFQKSAEMGDLACSNQNSTGAVFADIDQDQDLDLLVSGLGAGIRLFLNDGTGRFTESTSKSGLGSKDATMTMALADVDGDGDLDLYAANFQLDSLQDRLNVRFSLTQSNGIPIVARINGKPATLDEQKRYRINPNTLNVEEQGQEDKLFLNQGSGLFKQADWSEWFRDENGKRVAPPTDWGLAAMFHDMNLDGRPDLYVCNDTHTPDRIWINQKGTHFNALDSSAIRQTSLSSMGVDFADIDRDGDDDILVVDMLSRNHVYRHTQLVSRALLHPVGLSHNRPQYMKNTLFLNHGNLKYAEIGRLAGVDASEWSWSPVFIDVDLDGRQDLLITTGLERSLRDADARTTSGGGGDTTSNILMTRSNMQRLDTPNFAFRNTGNLTFVESSSTWGFDSSRVSQGMALADLDGDGDLDVAINCMNSMALLYRNNTLQDRVSIALVGDAYQNTSIGARLVLHDASGRQSKELTCGGRYLSGDQVLASFALPSDNPPAKLEVHWPWGQHEIIEGIYPGFHYQISPTHEVRRVETDSTPLQKNHSPWFADVSERLNHHHHEIHFNDFERQPLLPHRLSQPGPGLAWTDINHDGRDDLILGSGRAGPLSVAVNKEGGGFIPIDTSGLLGKMPGDVTSVLWAPYSPNSSRLWMGISNYETGNVKGPAVIEVSFDNGSMRPRSILSNFQGTAHAMSLGDLDGDGDLDLFVGGQSRAGDYPGRAESIVLWAEGENWSKDEGAIDMFKDVDIVNASVISDMDSDGRPELVVAGEWDRIRVFSKSPDGWRERSEEIGLISGNGLWQSLLACDVNQDGRMDLVAGNWGLNCRYQYYLPSGIGLFHGDLDGNGIREVLEVYRERGSDQWLPWRHLDTMQLGWPGIDRLFSGYRQYSLADAELILGKHKKNMKWKSCATLASQVWLQTDNGFQSIPLPIEAQFTPVFGLGASDFDGDGLVDLFTSQNFFGTNPDSSRMDAGRGLVLKGNGDGTFSPVSHEVSGIEIPGEQRSAGVCDFNADGRSDLVVSQNGAQTRLFENRSENRGIRVRLLGREPNYAGIGSRLWLTDKKGQKGMVAEVQAGSGYLSQHSLTLVLTHPHQPEHLNVIWPGGKLKTYHLNSGLQDIAVSEEGGVFKRI